VQAVACNGFGGDVKFRLDGGVVCSLLSAAIGERYDYLALYIDGSCSAASLASQHDVGHESAQACSLASHLLTPWAKQYAILAGVACAVGGPFGAWIESASERNAAQGVIKNDKCLKFTTHRFPTGDVWGAVKCAPTDRGFAGLSPATIAPQLVGSSGIYRMAPRLDGRLIPWTLGQTIARFGKPSSEHTYPAVDYSCLVTWKTKHMSELFGGGPPNRCAASQFPDSLEVGSGWRTDLGLAVGQPASLIPVLYPSAFGDPSSWVLSPAGVTGQMVFDVKNGRIRSISIFTGLSIGE
jgi:hypothetical protein